MMKRTVISRLILSGCCLALAVWTAPAFTSGQSQNETDRIFAGRKAAGALPQVRSFAASRRVICRAIRLTVSVAGHAVRRRAR
jgi:hypothetical protein